MKRSTVIANRCVCDCLINLAVDDFISDIEKAAILTAVANHLYDIREKFIYEEGHIDLWDMVHQIEKEVKEALENE